MGPVLTLQFCDSVVLTSGGWGCKHPSFPYPECVTPALMW